MVDRIRDIVTGYLRNIEQILQLQTNDNPFFIIPLEILDICQSYIDNHFFIPGINSGSYTWLIKDSILINKILRAKCYESFKSKEFRIANLDWFIEIYPNGECLKSLNSFKIFIKLVKYPKHIKILTVYRTIYCAETHASYTTIKPYKYNDYNGIGWFDKMVLLSELKDTKVITIQIELRILQVILQNDITATIRSPCNDKIIPKTLNTLLTASDIKQKRTIILDIDQYDMKHIMKCHNEKPFDYLSNDRMWCISYFPNGMNTNDVGYLSIFLGLCYLPNGVESISVKFTILCKETRDSCSYTCTFEYKDGGWSWGHASLMSLKDMITYKTLKFIIKLEIKKLTLREYTDRFVIADELPIQNALYT